eukprot:SAG11_NODE_28888_length_316_cov_2.585253_1_plen_29_part_10
MFRRHIRRSESGDGRLGEMTSETDLFALR